MNKNSKIISIKKPAYFSFQECLWFLDRGYDDCLYQLDHNSITKPIVINHKQILLKVSESDLSLDVEILHGDVQQSESMAIDAYITDWFDLDRDLGNFYQLLGDHPSLNFMVSEFHGLRLLGIPDLFEAICWCIIGQQINLSFAHRLKRRLVETYGEIICHDRHSYHLFPKPEILASLKREDLLALQFSRQKADYVIGIASDFSMGKMSKAYLLNLPDTKARLDSLLQIHGIGQWTANYVLMKTTRDISCIPYGDAGLHKALKDYLNFVKKPDAEQMQAFFKPFPGWESYLVFYLWRSLT